MEPWQPCPCHEKNCLVNGVSRGLQIVMIKAPPPCSFDPKKPPEILKFRNTLLVSVPQSLRSSKFAKKSISLLSALYTTGTGTPVVVRFSYPLFQIPGTCRIPILRNRSKTPLGYPRITYFRGHCFSTQLFGDLRRDLFKLKNKHHPVSGWIIIIPNILGSRMSTPD